MVKEVRLYVEGGGDQTSTKLRFRQGLQQFLSELRNQARARGVRWEVVVCGGRAATLDMFRRAMGQHRQAFNVLLVDAEGAVTAGSPWGHLKQRDGWDNPGATDDQCHLMVPTMEAWVIADREKLREFYGQRFLDKALPKGADVERTDKEALRKALAKATAKTTKGPYHKTRHAPKLLEVIRAAEVRRRASYCERLFTVLAARITG